MNVFSRGVRNAFRNGIRTLSIVIILGLSIGLSLAMLVARQAVQHKIDSVKSSIGNTISVSPAGLRGFAGGGEPLTTDQMRRVATLANVASVSESLNDRLSSTTSNLVSAIEPGSLGNRQAGNSGVGFGPPPNENGTGSSDSPDTNQRIARTFTPPVIVTGINSTSDPAVYGGSSVTFTNGEPFDATKDENVAAVGKELAAKNSLSVGSTFNAYSTTVKVVGIYDAGNTFANAGLVMQLAALQRISSQPNAVTAATITVNSVDNIDSVTAAVKNSLGTSADVVSNQDSAKQAVAPLENVKTISLYSLIAALVAGAVIILLTMIMIVRERRREIGVMKAIGAPNMKIMVQFMSEAITLTVLGLIVGLLVGIAAANPITKVLVNNSTSNSQTVTTTTTQRGFGGGQRAIRMTTNNSLTSIRTIKTDVGLNTIGFGIGAALIIAIVGSALPAYLISKVRPAEVMRAE